MSADLGRCLVTGATGFVGRTLVSELLSSGVTVRVMIRRIGDALPGCESVMASMQIEQEKYADALKDIDTVFHVAGVAHARLDTFDYQFHCDATLALAAAAASAGVQRFVYVSSIKAATDRGNQIADENDSGWPDEPYGYWKRVTENRLLDEVPIAHISILRPCLVYGAGVKGNLYSMLRAIDKHYFPPLPETGSERSMVSVTDVAKALVLLAGHPDADRRIFIASDGQPYTAHKIYTAMRHALGYSPALFSMPFHWLRAVGLVGDMISRVWRSFPINSGTIERLTGSAVYSAERLRALGWQPTSTFEQELPLIVDVYRKGKP